MRSGLVFAMALLSLMLGGCQSIFSRDMRLAAADPLFGAELDRCLDDPEFMISLMAAPGAGAPDIKPKRRPGDTTPPVDCTNLKKMFQTYLFESDAKQLLNGMEEAEFRRNEIVQALVGISNRKCGRYSAHIKTFDGQSNSILSVLSIATGGIGGVVGSKDAARILAGTSGIASGSRVAVNDAWFSNQTIQVLVAGYEKERSNQLRAIQHRQMCPIKYYPTMAGIADVMQYHASCSLITGLSAAAQAIERSDQPGVDVVRRQLTEMAAIRRQANLVVSGLTPGSSTETEQADSELAAVNARLSQIDGELILSAKKLTDYKLAADGVTPIYPDASAKAAIAAEIAELERQKGLAETQRLAAIDRLKKAQDLDRTSGSTGSLSITQSQSEFLQCPLGDNKAS